VAEVDVTADRKQVGRPAGHGFLVQCGQLVRDQHDGESVDDRMVRREEHGETVAFDRLERREDIRRPAARRGVLVEQILEVCEVVAARCVITVADDAHVQPALRYGAPPHAVGLRVEGRVRPQHFVAVGPLLERRPERRDLQGAGDLEGGTQPGLPAAGIGAAAQVRLVDIRRRAGIVHPFRAGAR
jgi:hypothetical protein